MNVWIDPTASVDTRATLGEGTRVWGLAKVREAAQIGDDVTIGRAAYIGLGVIVGDNCKIQDQALVYEPARLGRGVFIGPGAILTNDRHPRAVTPALKKKTADDWHPVGVIIEHGAAVGAGSVVVAPVTIGAWALIGAGSVVTRDVPRFAAVVGNPARRIAWVGRAGVALEPVDTEGSYRCPITGSMYRLAEPEILLEGRPSDKAKTTGAGESNAADPDSADHA